MFPSAFPASDDRFLRDLAAEPPKPLFSVLRHSEAMAPLVLVLAFLPTLYAVAHGTLTEAGAQQGLLSLECLSASTLNDFVDPAATGSSAGMAYQPLLMNWFTALAMRLAGVGQVAGQVASAYLCTACLILSAYVLGRRLDDDRLGLFAALLLAFNPHVLKLAQEPLPPSAAALFAVLTLAGAVAHWQKSSALVSVQLLLGGIALGLCLLAGGPVAIAVLVILVVYATWWKTDGWRRVVTDSPFERSAISRGNALRSVLILGLTGFAVGGWRSLLMGQRHGADFWGTWFGYRAAPEASPGAASVADWTATFLRANHLVLPLSMLALVGAGVIVTELLRRKEDPGRRHRGLLLVWLFVAGVLWMLSKPGNDAAIRLDAYWTILLIVPLAMSAAVGLLAVIDRRIPFRWAVAIGLVTCVDLVLAGRWGLTPTDGRSSHNVLGWMLVPLVAAAAAAAIVGMARASLSGETRRHGMLACVVLGVIAANCVWGAVAVRRSNLADRELDDLRTALARVPGVTRWTLVVPTQSMTETVEPPAPLVYTLRSMWPEADLTSLNSWDALAAQLAAERAAGASPGRIVVTWSPQGRVRPTVPAGLLKAAAPPFLYRDHEVAAYIPGDAPP